MIAARESFLRFTPEEYFEWEEQQEIRHEYFDGEVYAMTGGTLNHSEIAINFGSLLKAHLRGGKCRVLNGDAKVKIYNSNKYVYPDLSVTCNERDRNNTKFVSHPCLIGEVLSPSTEAYDRGDKFAVYRLTPSLQDYVLISANKMAIDIYNKDNRDKWDIINYRSGDLVDLASINLTFPIEQIYEDIIFEVDQQKLRWEDPQLK
ncbi:MAG: Uma2 family endonuclease [Chamaesiphon sp.]|nr:Uma2 family endonuclease [Chamaesiphon sp.]